MREPRSGVLAEFCSQDALLSAIDGLLAARVRRIETFTPVACPEVDARLGRGPSRVPVAMLVGGLVGAGGAYGLQWLITAYLYRVHVGGRPPHFPLAYVPITFEMGVLLAAITGFIGVIAAGRLLRLWSPLFEVTGFESATNDRYWLAVDRCDPAYDPEQAALLLRAHGARQVRFFGDDDAQTHAPAGRPA